jgi:asparagine synthase (glutamine-hydrolysing)
MAGIFGIINTEGKPVDRDELERMAHVMEYWGPHGLSVWCEGCAGLGHLQLRITPESVHERFPIIDSHWGLVMVSAGRIDNRDELFGAFNTPLGQRSSIPDSQLMFDAYRKWGKECVHHLTGDWNLAVWHKQERKLFVARDHIGISGLYYHINGQQFIFASSLKGLLVLPQIPRKINELRIAQILVSWHGDGVQTAYEGILRLPPAHHITLTGSRVEKTRYHSFENIAPLRYRDDNEYIEHFRELFAEAVRCRLRTNGRVGSTLSSGLDSSSISAVAANLLKEKGIRLPVFTSVPMYECQHLVPPHRLADEGPLAAKLVEFNGNMDHNLCKAERISVLEGIRKMLWVHDQPFHAAGNAFWIVDMMENLQQHGCNVLLTGQFGNGTISWPTSGYTKQALAPQRPIISFDNLLHVKKFRQNILNPLIPIPLLNQIVKFKHGPRPWEHHSAIKGSFAEKIRLREHMQRAGFDPTFSLRRDLSKMQLELIKPGENIVGQQWQETGSAFSLEVRDPSMDKRIVEYCLAVPERIYFQNGQGRLLIRRAMEGIIPDEILWSQQRGCRQQT